MNKEIHMQTKLRTLPRVAVLLTVVAFSPIASADDGGAAAAAAAQAMQAVTSAINSMSGILNEIKSELNNFYSDFKAHNGINASGYNAPSIFATPELDKITATNQALIDATKNMDAYERGKSLADSALIEYMTTPGDALTCNNCEEDRNVLPRTVMGEKFFADQSIANPYTLEIHGQIDGTLIEKIRSEFSGGKFQDTKSIMADTFLAPRFYTEEKQDDAKMNQLQHADRFIKLASGALYPLKLLNHLPSTEETDEGVVPRYQYLMRVYQYISRQSLGMSNLYQIYAGRLKPSDDAKSAVETEHDAATRRMKADWHNSMEKASGLTLQRELLYLMAEMNYQLYQKRRADERLLATVSLLQLQLLEVNRGSIEQNM